MLIHRTKSYRAVLCDSCSIKKNRCFICRKETNSINPFEANIYECCVSNKKLKCAKCTKAILTFTNGYNYGVLC